LANLTLLTTSLLSR